MSMSASDVEQFRRMIEAEKMSGASIIGNPNILTGIGTPMQIRPQYEFTTAPNTMLYHASIERAENGYILKVQHKQNETAKIYIAATTEELQRVFIAAIVAERVSK